MLTGFKKIKRGSSEHDVLTYKKGKYQIEIFNYNSTKYSVYIKVSEGRVVNAQLEIRINIPKRIFKSAKVDNVGAFNARKGKQFFYNGPPLARARALNTLLEVTEDYLRKRGIKKVYGATPTHLLNFLTKHHGYKAAPWRIWSWISDGGVYLSKKL